MSAVCITEKGETTYMDNCLLCNLDLHPEQTVILSNEYCMFLQLEQERGQHIPHAHLHVLPRYDNEPLAGKGIRYMFKGELNIRNG